MDDATQGVPIVQSPQPGWVLGGRYRVLDRIGMGGMAEVFRAHDELLDRDVAVKVFRTAIDDGDEAAATRRQLELRSLAHLNHPNLVALYDGSVADERPAYLVLELVTGPNLADRLVDGPLSNVEARVIGAQLADALAYVHATGLVHRDVKPANILLGTDPTADDTMATDLRAVRARLSDFGIVRIIGSQRMTAVDLTVGTAWYVAPEQARGADVGPPADVYSLGLVLFEGLTGTRAFDGPIHETLAARLVSPPAIPAGVPAPWPALLTAMTATDPAARPSAAQVAEALRDVSATGAPAVPGPPPVSRPPAVVGPTIALGSAAAAYGAGPAPRVAGLPVNEPATAYTSFAAALPVGRSSARHSSGRLGVLIAACVLFLLLIGGGAWFLLRSTGPSTPGDVPQTTQSTHSAARTSVPSSAPGSRTASGGPTGRSRSSSSRPSSSASASSSSRAPSSSSSTPPSSSASSSPSSSPRSSPTSSSSSASTSSSSAAAAVSPPSSPSSSSSSPALP